VGRRGAGQATDFLIGKAAAGGVARPAGTTQLSGIDALRHTLPFA
jgi:hypothetical protein